MSTNSLTLQHVYDRRATKTRDYMTRYVTAMQRAVTLTARAENEADDAAAIDACETARKLAHIAADHGEYEPLFDQLERAYQD
jgi:hypothetical protein